MQPRATKADFFHAEPALALFTFTLCMILCLANAFKPPVIDDPAYLWYARQIQQTPLEPFGPPPDGFPLIWYHQKQGAFSLLTPMVVPYYLAVGMQCSAEARRIKALAPAVLLVVYRLALCALAPVCSRMGKSSAHHDRHLADLPAQRQSDDRSPCDRAWIGSNRFVLSGHPVTENELLFDRAVRAWAGLAAQTKYNAAVATAAILWAGIVYRRKVAAILVVILSVAVFVDWELYLRSVYGESHFLAQLEVRRFKPPEVDTDASRFAGSLRKPICLSTRNPNFSRR